MLRRIIERLTEPSSLAGLAGLAMLLGQSVEQAAATANAAALVLGVAAVAVKEKGNKP